MSLSLRSYFLNCFSAFADCAVLLPLLLAMEQSGGMNSVRLLLSTGIIYGIAGVVFKIPMSVQPLKSIAIAGVATGATAVEIRWSGFLVGLVCFTALIAHLDRFAILVPQSVIQSVQFSLGLLLVLQGVRTGAVLSPHGALVALALSILMVGIPYWTSFPVLGLVATFAVLYGIWKGGVPHSNPVNTLETARPGLILALVLPQLALTSANSVLGTRDVAQRYFGAKASRVTVPRLLASIGIGNMICGLIGGLPFCHGSGGITAHVKGGASHWVMNVFAAVFFILLAIAAALRGGILMPPIFVPSLLAVTGIFHLMLAKPMLSTSFGRWELVTAGLLTLVFQNLLIVLAVVALLESSRVRKFVGFREV